MKYQRLIKLAKNINIYDVDSRLRHFAFILHGNKILSIATNTKRTHTINLRYNYQNFNKGLHAEARAVIKLGRDDCSGLTMVTFRLASLGELALGKPCRGCQSLLDNLNFKKIYFSNIKGEIELLK